MKQDLKKGWRFMFCGVSRTMNLVCMVVFFVLGIFLEIVAVMVQTKSEKGIVFSGDMGVLSAVIFFCSAMFPAQLITSMDVTLLAQSSPYKKKMQTTLPCLWTLVSNLVAMSMIILVRVVMAAAMPGQAKMIFSTLHFSGIVGFALAVYSAFVYKYFIASLVVLYIGIVISGMGRGISIALSMMSEGQVALKNGMPLYVSVPLCYALIFAGCGLQYLITKAIYRKNFSKYAFGSSIKKLM